MRDVNLCYLLEGNKILLGLKKRGFGQGKWNGIGGKPEPYESIEESAVRELKEEIGIAVSKEDLKKVAEIDFFFTNAPEDWDQKVHVFFIEKWKGKPKETEEIKPAWFNAGELPFDKMWQDDPHWMPLVLNGKKLKGSFTFGEDNDSIIEKEINLIKKF